MSSTINLQRIKFKPGGADRQLQFNNNGVVDGTENIEYNNGRIQFLDETGIDFAFDGVPTQSKENALFATEYISGSGAPRKDWLEVISTVTADSSYSQTGHKAVMNWDWSGLGSLEISALTYKYFDLDFTESQGRSAFGVSDITVFDVDLYPPAIGTNYFWDLKSASVSKSTLDHLGNVTFAGTLGVTGAATLSSTLSVTGTATFNGASAIDVNGTSQFDGAVSVGVNDTGHDVTFFGATSGRRFLWDESADLLDLSGAMTITNGKLTTAASTTSFASLNIPEGTAPSSPASGDIWSAIQMFTNTAGITAPITRAVGIMTSSRTVANTTNATSLNQSTAEGLVTVPANQWRVGKSYLVISTGFYGTTGTPNLTMNLRVGGTVVATTGAQAMGSNVSASLWWGIFQITCRTTGSGGTQFNQGFVTYYSAGVILGGAAFSAHNTGTDALNTTLSRDIDITVQWGTQSSSNTITLTNHFVIEL